jgi:hypothetical protein
MSLLEKIVNVLNKYSNAKAVVDTLLAWVNRGQTTITALGGPGYDEFLKQSECKAYKAGKACRESIKCACPDAELNINSDNEHLQTLGCQ